MKRHWMASLARPLALGLALPLALPLALGLAASGARAESSSPWELKASLAFSGEGGQYLLAYSSNEADSGPNIYGRVLAADGTPMGKDFHLSTQDGLMDKPVIAYNPHTRQFLVAWGRKGEGRAEIVGLNVGLDGHILGQEFAISFSDLFDLRPSIAYCPGRDRYLVTWTRGTHYDFEKGISDVYGQFVDGDGQHLAGSNFVIASATKNQFKSEVACDPVDDRFLVAWEDQRHPQTQDDVYGQLIASDGTMVGGNFLIAGTANVERRPAIAADTKDGSYLLVWEEWGDGRARMMSQKVDADGHLLKQPVPVGDDLGGDRDRAALAYLPKQDVFLVAFANTGFNGVSDGIYGQFMAPDGSLRQGAFPLTTARSVQYRPDVAAAWNDFLVVWTDYRDTLNTKGKRTVYEYYGRVIGNDMPLSARWKNPESR
jgi:hypothetical protein